ncbi:MAG: 30S ribosomal protein S16 [Actinomycetota bacterium]|nr:MAG: 30S ribosomal protein S16 [Actinomycetota bacterium]
MSVKIKLKRLGKVRNPQYRVVVADSRTKRDGRAIEEIGLYHPKEEPSLISIDSARVQYWLSVGAQPTEPVLALLKVTGDWQRFKGLPGAEGTLRVAAPRTDRREVFAAAAAAAASEAPAPTTKRTAPAKEAAAKDDTSAAESAPVEPAVESAPAATQATGDATAAADAGQGADAAAQTATSEA